MNAPKHTPGPWHMSRVRTGGPNLGADIGAENGANVAVVHYEPLDQSLAETVANGRLIAAAPDLLAVVRRGRQKLATYTAIYTGDKELRELLAAWDAAIARAESGQ